MMKQLFLIFLAFSTFSCSSPDSDLFEIDPRTFKENIISLTDIADDITYIPLDNSIPIGITYTIRVTNNNIYMSIKDVGIVKYDKSGKIVHKIGTKGRGPGEYYYGYDFAVDERTGNVFVLEPGKVKVYTHEGVFMRDISYEKYIQASPGGLELFNSLLFIPDYLMHGNSKYCWILLDTTGNLVSYKENSIPEFQVNASRRGCVYMFENNLYYFNYFNDTIFSVSPDLKSKGEYLFAQGEHRWPRSKIEFIASIPQTQAWLYTMFQPGPMFETKKYIVLRYGYRDKNALCMIDKETKRTFLAYRFDNMLDNRTYSKPYLKNDLDGGIALSDPIKYYSENDKEFIITVVNAFDLKDHIARDDFRNSNPAYPEKKKEFEKLANSLEETDNPVLMMVRLKE